MLLFKTYILEFAFDRHLELMVSYQGMQSGISVFLVSELSTFEILCKIGCLVNPDFSYFSNYQHKR